MSQKTRPRQQGGHPIGIVAARTGLSPDVLRVWERRYEVVQPERSPDGQRLYSDDDIARLNALRLATSAGRSIGQVARLSAPELARLIDEDRAASAVRASTSDVAMSDAVIEEALERTRALDAAGLNATLRRSLALHGLEVFLEGMVVGLLREVGELWHQGKLTAAQEHLASSVVQQVILESMRSFAVGENADTVVVATPAGERHAIGAALLGAWAAAQGWHVVYLGADLPATDIAASAIAAHARRVALSIIYLEDRRRTLGELQALRSALPAGIELAVGGAGAGALKPELAKLGIQLGARLTDF